MGYMQTDRVGRRYNCAGNDVVSVEQRTCYWLTDSIDVYWRCSDESDDEAGSCGEQAGNHQDTEPAYIQAVVGGGDPAAELLPCRSVFTLLEGSCHVLMIAIELSRYSTYVL